MALTPTQMGTKSRSLTGPSNNIRSRPNGLGRSPRMGRVHQLSPYVMGELVETPMGLRRIKGITPFTMNIDLGPRGALAATVSAGSTTITIKNFNTPVSFLANDILIIGGPNDSYRETVKINAPVTLSTDTVSVALSAALTHSHASGDLVVSQKLPPDYEGEFTEVEELKILGNDRYAYIVPSVPKQPRYISRTGSFGDDTVKQQETATDIDVTDNFRRYETIPIEIYKRHIRSTNVPAEVGNQFYQIYALKFNSDGTSRPYFEQSLTSGGEDVLYNANSDDTKDPMLITADLIELGSAEARHVWAEVHGGASAYVASHFYLRINIPTNWPEGSNPTEKAITFRSFIREHLIFFGGRQVGTGLIPGNPDGYGIILAINQNPIDSEPFSSLDDYNTWNNISIPAYKNPLTAGLDGYHHIVEAAFDVTNPAGLPTVYLANAITGETDSVVATPMQQTIQISGTISGTGGSTTITGSGTSFTSQLSSTSGSRKSILKIEGISERFTIASITNDTSLTLSGALGSSISGKKAYVTSFENIPITRLDFRILDATRMLNQRIEFRGTTTTNSDNTGSISQKVFLQLPQGQTRWSSKKALDNGKNEETGFIDCNQSPEDSPNETFGFYVGKNEESLPYMKSLNKTGETILDGRVKLSGFIIDAPRVEAQELKKLQQRAGYYKAKLFPHTGFFPNLNDRPDGPPDGWEPRSRRVKRTLLESLSELSTDVKKEIRGG